ncbi:MAG: DegT/DnrJ/EryC1/StrS family aminotransferase [Chloroflexota bacterium]
MSTTTNRSSAAAGPLAIEGGTPVRTDPFPSWPIFDETEITAVTEVLRSGVWGSAHGRGTVARFEAAFAPYQGAKHALCVTNGTQALRVALLAADVGEGDEVIVPAYTFVATAGAVLEAGAIPIFVDIDPATFNLDPALVEAALTPRTRAIIPVHFGGLAVDMDSIMDLAARHSLVVVEDSCHGHGAEWRGRRLGSIGHLGCFSDQSTKNLTAGEGGIVLTQDDTLAARARTIANLGRVLGGGWYDHATLGTNLRMTEFQGALLLAQFSRLEAQTVRRDENGRYLDELLAAVPGIVPQRRLPAHTRCSYHLYLFRYESAAFGGRSRAEFLEALKAEGIPASGGYAIPLYRQPLFARSDFGPALRTYARTLDYSRVSLPHCEAACAGAAVWLGQNLLLADSVAMEEIATAIARIQTCWAR